MTAYPGEPETAATLLRRSTQSHGSEMVRLVMAELASEGWDLTDTSLIPASVLAAAVRKVVTA